MPLDWKKIEREVEFLELYKADPFPRLMYDDIRADVETYLEEHPESIPVQRIGVRRLPDGSGYGGVIDSDLKPYWYVMSGKGFACKEADDAEGALIALQEMLTTEQRRSILVRKQEAKKDLIEIVIDMSKSRAKPYGHKAYWRRTKTGKMAFVREKGVPKPKLMVAKDKPQAAVEGPTRAKFDFSTVTDRVERKLITQVKRATTPEEMEKLVFRTWHKMHPDSPITRAHAKECVEGWQEQKVLTFVPVEKKKPKVEKGKKFDTQEIQYVVLPPRYKARGVPLVVNGKRVKLSAELEQACAAYAKRVKGDKPPSATFRNNFEKWLRGQLELKTATISFTEFDKHPEPEKKAAPKKAAEMITFKSHPEKFVVRNNEPLLVSTSGDPLQPGFYTGADNEGVWVLPVYDTRITLNGTKTPKGWKGKTTVDKTGDWIMRWTHQITGKMQYRRVSRAAAYIEKFDRMHVLHQNLAELRKELVRDLSSKDARTRQAAAIAYLIDVQKFRIGGEEFADEHGTYGASSFRAAHLKISGNKATFAFTAKKQVPWVRTIDCPPGLAKILQDQLKGKKPEDRLWDVDEKGVNNYLKKYQVDKYVITAKDFRTHHANSMMLDWLTKVDELVSAGKLDKKDLKAFYKGFKIKAKNKGLIALAKLLNMPLYEQVNKKGKVTQRLYGVVPSIAHEMGHTTGSCRASYIDPMLVVPWSKNHGWDDRTNDEKKFREDLDEYAMKKSLTRDDDGSSGVVYDTTLAENRNARFEGLSPIEQAYGEWLECPGFDVVAEGESWSELDELEKASDDDEFYGVDVVIPFEKAVPGGLAKKPSSAKKKKKPYGHVSYRRRTKTGRTVMVGAKGVKPTKPAIGGDSIRAQMIQAFERASWADSEKGEKMIAIYSNDTANEDWLREYVRREQCETRGDERRKKSKKRPKIMVRKAFPKPNEEESAVHAPRPLAAATKVPGETGKTRYNYPTEKGKPGAPPPAAKSGGKVSGASQKPPEKPEKLPEQAGGPGPTPDAEPPPEKPFVDPTKLATFLHTSVGVLRKIAMKFHTDPSHDDGRKEFQKFMRIQLKGLNRKHDLDNKYFGLVYDALVNPPPKPPAPPKAGGKGPGGPGPAGPGKGQ